MQKSDIKMNYKKIIELEDIAEPNSNTKKTLDTKGRTPPKTFMDLHDISPSTIFY